MGNIIVLVLMFLLMFGDLANARRHHHYRYHSYGTPEITFSETYLQSPFCSTVSSAFYSLDIKALDNFVKNIPFNKHKEALKCIETIRKNKLLQEIESLRGDSDGRRRQE